MLACYFSEDFLKSMASFIEGDAIVVDVFIPIFCGFVNLLLVNEAPFVE